MPRGIWEQHSLRICKGVQINQKAFQTSHRRRTIFLNIVYSSLATQLIWLRGLFLNIALHTHRFPNPPSNCSAHWSFEFILRRLAAFKPKARSNPTLKIRHDISKPMVLWTSLQMCPEWWHKLVSPQKCKKRQGHCLRSEDNLLFLGLLTLPCSRPWWSLYFCVCVSLCFSFVIISYYTQKVALYLGIQILDFLNNIIALEKKLYSTSNSQSTLISNCPTPKNLLWSGLKLQWVLRSLHFCFLIISMYTNHSLYTPQSRHGYSLFWGVHV